MGRQTAKSDRQKLADKNRQTVKKRKTPQKRWTVKKRQAEKERQKDKKRQTLKRRQKKEADNPKSGRQSKKRKTIQNRVCKNPYRTLPKCDTNSTQKKKSDHILRSRPQFSFFMSNFLHVSLTMTLS